MEGVVNNIGLKPDEAGEQPESNSASGGLDLISVLALRED